MSIYNDCVALADANTLTEEHEDLMMDLNEKCWETGYYSDECICELCDHRYECSGYDSSEDDNEE